MIDYTVVQTFDIVAEPLPTTGQDLRVWMKAEGLGVENSQYQAPERFWEDDYLYPLQHSAGLEPEMGDELTKRLQTGRSAFFRVTCFPQQLEAVGFTRQKTIYVP